MSKYEKEWPHDNCDECGSELVIRTDCPDEGMVHDGDDAYCPDCKRVVGTISIEDGDSDDAPGRAWVNQFW